MNIEPIAFFHSPMTSKFGIPRQSGLAEDLPGHIVFVPVFRHLEAVRGLEGFDFVWLIWHFSANRDTAGDSLTVRPPRLGGNERVGVFASRSPYRPNGLGLSCVRLDRIDTGDSRGPVIHVLGADLMDGTPIFDIKPYVVYADSRPNARSGFVDDKGWASCTVVIPEDASRSFSPKEIEGLRQVLSHDPRPRYHDDDSRVYGMPYAGRDVRFTVSKGQVRVVEIK